MPPRVGSALDYLAAAIVALAVLALPISIFALAKGRHETWLVVACAVGWPLAALCVVRFVRTRADSLDAIKILVGATFSTWFAAFLGGTVALSILFSSTRCTTAFSGWAGLAGGVAIYVTAGAVSLKRGREGTAVWALPAAAIVGCVWAVMMWRFLPAAPGFCGD